MFNKFEKYYTSFHVIVRESVQILLKFVFDFVNSLQQEMR